MLTTAGLLMLVTFVAFESMAVATAMPTAVRELHGLAWYGWPFSAFLVASVFGMVLGGDLDDRRGSQAAVLAGVATFAAGLLAGGLSGPMAVFIAARALQGVGGGIISVALYVWPAGPTRRSSGRGCSPPSRRPGCCRRWSGRAGRPDHRRTWAGGGCSSGCCR